MADISIIEFAVYGFIAYSGMLMLIISIIKEVPMTKVLSIIRVIYLLPSIMAAGILIQVGPNIVESSTTNTIIAVNTSEVWTETIASNIVLQNEVWAIFHILIFLTMIVYFISNILLLATRRE